MSVAPRLVWALDRARRRPAKERSEIELVQIDQAALAPFDAGRKLLGLVEDRRRPVLEFLDHETSRTAALGQGHPRREQQGQGLLRRYGRAGRADRVGRPDNARKACGGGGPPAARPPPPPAP